MRPVRRTDNITTFMCRLSWNLGASTSWNPQGLSRPVMGLLHLYLIVTGPCNCDILCSVWGTNSGRWFTLTLLIMLMFLTLVIFCYHNMLYRKGLEPSIRFFGRSRARCVLIRKSTGLNIDSVSYISAVDPIFDTLLLSKSRLIKR
jgi:hypothetical protein